MKILRISKFLKNQADLDVIRSISDGKSLDAQQEITDIMDDGEHPYHNGKHREHLQAVEHMRQLHEKVFGK